jgi:hypothetical protein
MWITCKKLWIKQKKWWIKIEKTGREMLFLVENAQYLVEKIGKTIGKTVEKRGIIRKLLGNSKKLTGEIFGTKMWISALFLWITPIYYKKTVLEIC